ncbi:MAG: GIY-YIG nuclease family protein [Ignavibacteriae bacterium]|nr:GIY-YIG nuclease family protein [Ignavibacteria bacterium]MBI3364954.1 GIY-YIG nuclease family protein [Ignavibacteriota bacterium]
MHAWVYILECADQSYYTGCSTKPIQRLSQHQLGSLGGYTASRRPVTLRWSQEFADLFDAFRAERQIKGWSRAKKEALIAGRFDLLHELAQSTEVRNRRRRKGGLNQTPSRSR